MLTELAAAEVVPDPVGAVTTHGTGPGWQYR
jgi:hypothetical protein